VKEEDQSKRLAIQVILCLMEDLVLRDRSEAEVTKLIECIKKDDEALFQEIAELIKIRTKECLKLLKSLMMT